MQTPDAPAQFLTRKLPRDRPLDFHRVRAIVRLVATGRDPFKHNPPFGSQLALGDEQAAVVGQRVMHTVRVHH